MKLFTRIMVGWWITGDDHRSWSIYHESDGSWRAILGVFNEGGWGDDVDAIAGSPDGAMRECLRKARNHKWEQA